MVNLAELLQLPVFNLEGWHYIGPCEGNIDIYARGNERVVIDRKSGRLITRYLMNRDLQPKPRFPSGIDVISQGKCPQGSVTPLACMFCTTGHMTECHHPWGCSEIECSHYLEELQAELDQVEEEVE